ncbi:MAG: TetR/AcrR family transcriptional regulator [Stackebrandtia sp.]
MARTKEFEPEIALRRAIELFLRQGYEATSMSELVEHLGVSRASLYATFGNKEELYRKALDLFQRSNPVDVAEILSRPGPVLDCVRELVDRYAEQAKRVGGSGACLVVDAAIERMSVDAAVSRQVESGWEFLESSLRMALRRAQAQGELSGDADPGELASFILVMLQGIRIFARSDTGAARIEAAVEQTIAALK